MTSNKKQTSFANWTMPCATPDETDTIDSYKNSCSDMFNYAAGTDN